MQQVPSSHRVPSLENLAQRLVIWCFTFTNFSSLVYVGERYKCVKDLRVVCVHMNFMCIRFLSECIMCRECMHEYCFVKFMCVACMWAVSMCVWMCSVCLWGECVCVRHIYIYVCVLCVYVLCCMWTESVVRLLCVVCGRWGYRKERQE